jgi:MFS family permease
MASFQSNEPESVRLRRSLAEALLSRKPSEPLPHYSSFKIPPRGSLRAFWYDGLLTSITDSLVLNFIPLFALKLGATGGQIGLLNAAAGILGTAMLLPGARLAEWWGRRKSYILLTSGLSRLTLLLMAMVPLGLPLTAAVTAIIVLNSLRVVFGNMGLPAWTSLSADVVPEQIRGRYFASRNAIIALASIVFAPFAGYVIARSAAVSGYQLIFTVAFISGMSALWFYSRIEEPKREGVEKTGPQRFPLLENLRSYPVFLRYSIYAMVWSFALNLAVPFFNVFLVEETPGTEAAVGYLAAVGSVVGLISQQFWGHVNDRWGARRTQLITASVIPFITLGWLFVRSPWHVVPINIASGLVWPGFNVASFNVILEVTPEERRPRFIALLNTLIGLATAAGATVGGWMVDVYGYRSVFWASGLMRIVGWVLFLVLVQPGKADSPRRR